MNQITEPYRPSDPYDRKLFTSRFCEKCIRDKCGECGIETDAQFFDIGDRHYPSAWVQDVGTGHPRCTAFVAEAPPAERTFLDV